MTYPTWTLQTDIGDVTADWLEGDLYDTAPASEISPTFGFISRSVDNVPSERHAALQPLVDAAQEGLTIDVGTNAEGRPYYRETLAGFDDVDSLLVALVPDGDRRGAVWAILRNGTDATPGVERDLFVWDLELTVLQRYDGEDRATIETEYTDEVL